jgi:flagellar basal body-associated protein FliL
MALLKKPAVLAVVGVLAGVVVMALVYTFVLSGGTASAVVATPEPTPVFSEGKLGPRLTLQDRVFNLRSPASAPIYAKIQTVIEFETTDERWAEVFEGCGHAMRLAPKAAPASALVASARPGAVPPPADEPPATSGGEEVGPCAALEAELLHEFEAEIGTGAQLIEDAVTTIVSAKTPDEVATTEGKEALKTEIKHAVEALVEHPGVTRVLFINFITQ